MGTESNRPSKSLSECSPEERYERISDAGWEYASNYPDTYRRRIPYDGLDIASAYMDGLETESKPPAHETSDVAALLTVQQENKRLRGALAAIEVGTPDLLPPFRAMGAKQMQEIAAKALRPAQKASEVSK